jgi:hypothetical protein
LKPSQRRPQLTDPEKELEGASRIAVQSILLGVLVSIPMGLGGVLSARVVPGDERRAAVITVDLPALFGPTRTLKAVRANQGVS